LKRIQSALLLIALWVSACAGPAATGAPPPVVTGEARPTITPWMTAVEASPTAAPRTRADCYTKDLSVSIDARVEKLLACLTLDEKIGQMTQVEKNSLKPGDVTQYFLGSVLSGGGGSPSGNNTPEGWAAMTNGFQEEALATRLGIPILYGVDAVHGHGNLYGATVFPQEVGLGAANDPELMQKIGRATAEEMLATGVTWNFAPVVAVPQDIRWGRTYEAYSEDTALVSKLGVAYLQGLQTQPAGFQNEAGDSIYVLATPKHFLGDGGTKFGTSTQNIMKPYLLDQGDMQVDEATVRKLYLPPYKAAVDAGAMSVMVSFSSWNGVKLHAQKVLITDVLKGELGFQGFVVSDWGGIDQIAPLEYSKAVVTAINAGVDMNMVPYDYLRFINTMKAAVASGEIPPERIDDAVRRILKAKFMLGLFYHPTADPAMLATVRSPEHLELAREAVRKSLVLLQNENGTLPLSKKMPSLFVAGRGADDLGMQAGGWTIEWQGKTGKTIVGTSLLAGIKAAVSPETQINYKSNGRFTGTAEVGLVVVGEQPYAEGVGDSVDLRLSAGDLAVLQNTRQSVKKLVVVILSGRPLVITEQLPQADAWVAAWLPGSEGQGVADVLFGDFPFTGKLPYTWPRTNEQLPINLNNVQTGSETPLFPFGFGLEIH
jgi:beta-glucosidase